METLAEKNKSLFAQLRELKARIGSIGGGRKSSNATLSMLVLWFGIYPASLLDLMAGSIQHVLDTVSSSGVLLVAQN